MSDRKRTDARAVIAYFSMEVGVDPRVPTYSGGLGVLAGDTLKAAADLGLPMVGMTLLHRKGYFRQRLQRSGQQIEEPVAWSPESQLQLLPERVSIPVNGLRVQLRPWRYVVRGSGGAEVPIYFLDASLPENSAESQVLTDHLYGGDDLYRFCQEAILGIGGVAMLRALGYRDVATFHMNEGHSALLTLALLEEQAGERGLAGVSDSDVDRVRERCVFTTHTPVPAGHDQFPEEMAVRVLGESRMHALRAGGWSVDGTLNMTYLALRLSRYVNGVAMRHGQVSRSLFPNYPIDSITNGVHVVTWTAPPFHDLFDRTIPRWRQDSQNLRYAVSIPLADIRKAHQAAKVQLFEKIYARTAVRLDPDVLTIGFARRAATYKRADLVFSDLDRLRQIVRRIGPLQIVYAGKAHPRDEMGKDLIRRVFAAGEALKQEVPVVYLEDYDMDIARFLCAGVDVWLNTPHKPQEASGTSGMKAALNGVPSFSVLDGWWVEGHVENVTGWSIGDSYEIATDTGREISSLYDKLEGNIMPMYYGRPSAFAEVMRWSIALNGSFFNARRMVLQYRENAYHL
ncbi:MAG TPA: alpha-glucan family phosphorylase [Terriglobales bacterium]|nr:alpha-glucan family phosphorylase [Terriglobales bacterium]